MIAVGSHKLDCDQNCSQIVAVLPVRVHDIEPPYDLLADTDVHSGCSLVVGVAADDDDDVGGDKLDEKLSQHLLVAGIQARKLLPAVVVDSMRPQPEPVAAPSLLAQRVHLQLEDPVVVVVVAVAEVDGIECFGLANQLYMVHVVVVVGCGDLLFGARSCKLAVCVVLEHHNDPAVASPHPSQRQLRLPEARAPTRMRKLFARMGQH